MGNGDWGMGIGGWGMVDLRGGIWDGRGIKHEWEPNLHLVPIPLLNNRSR